MNVRHVCHLFTQYLQKQAACVQSLRKQATVLTVVFLTRTAVDVCPTVRRLKRVYFSFKYKLVAHFW